MEKRESKSREMGKLLCDSSTVAETFQSSSPTVAWRDPPAKSAPLDEDPIEALDLVDQSTADAWDAVLGLEDQQRRHLQRLHAKGVLWKHPEEDDSSLPQKSMVFRLSHGGEVSSDGNCLFTASHKAMMAAREVDARELRRRTVRRFLEDYGSASVEERDVISDVIRHLYAPDLRAGWGIHVIQEVKLLAKKDERVSLDSAIDELLQLGMQRLFSWICFFYPFEI